MALYCAASAENVSKPKGMWPCEYLRTRSKCSFSSTLLKKGKAAEKMKTCTAASRHNSQTRLRSRDSETGTGGLEPAVFTPLILRGQIKARAANHKPRHGGVVTMPVLKLRSIPPA